MHIVSISGQASGCLPEPSLPATFVEWVDGVDDNGEALRAITYAWPTSPETHCDAPLNQMLWVRPMRFTDTR